MTQVPIGKDCILAYDVVTAWASPTWKPVVNAVDVSMPGITKTAIDLPSRGTAGWNLKGAGLKSLDLTFGYLIETGADTVLAALRDSYFNDTVLQFAVLDGPAGGVQGRAVQGFRFAGIVFEFPMTEELEDGRRVEIKVEAARFKHTDGSLRLPAWYEIAALT
jgi:hypothetical protein